MNGKQQSSGPSESQRQADRWLEGIEKRAREAGLATVECAGVSLEALRVLRSPLLLRCGRGLNLLHRNPDRDSQLLAVRQLAFLSLAEASAVGGAIGIGLGTSWGTGHVARATERARTWAYERREALRRAWTLRADRYLRGRELPSGGEPWILCIPRASGHLVDLIPVADELLRRGHRTVFAIPELGPYKTPGLERHERFLLSSRAHATRDQLRKLGADVGRIADWIERGDPARDTTSSFDRVVRAEAGLVVRECLPAAVRVAGAVREACLQHRPALCVVGNPYTFEGRGAAFEARRHGVPSAALEHGSILPGDRMWADLAVDRVFVWGEPSRAALLASGVPADRVVVTGAPRLDAVHSSRQAKSGTRILVAASGPGDLVSLPAHLEFISLVREAVLLAPDSRWVIKLHSKDSPLYYSWARSGVLRRRVTLALAASRTFGGDLLPWLEDACCLVTMYSSSAHEAMVVGVPVVSVALPSEERPPGVEFLERGCASVVRSAPELAHAIRLAAAGELAATRARAEAYAKEHFSNRGTASVAVADALLSLCARTS